MNKSNNNLFNLNEYNGVEPHVGPVALIDNYPVEFYDGILECDYLDIPYIIEA